MTGGEEELKGEKRGSTLGVLLLRASDGETYYHPHDFLVAHGYTRVHVARTLRTLLKKYLSQEEPAYADAELLNVRVGAQPLLCLNRDGMRVVFDLLYDAGAAAAAAEADSVRAAAWEVLGQRLGAEAPPDAEEASDELSELDEEEEPGSSAEAAAGSDEEGEAPGVAAQKANDAAEFALAPSIDYRKEARQAPGAADLTAMAHYMKRVHEQLVAALQEASKLQLDTPAALVADSSRRFLTHKEFWSIVGKVAPAVEGFEAPLGTRHRRRVPVPMDYSLLLQRFRAQTGLLRARDLKKAMRLGRVELETLLCHHSRKLAGTPADFALYALSRGAPRALITMLHQGTDMMRSYSSAIETRAHDALHAFTTFMQGQLEQPTNMVTVFMADNYFAQETCVLG